MYFDWNVGGDVFEKCVCLCGLVISMEWSIWFFLFLGLVMVVLYVVNYGLWNWFVGIWWFVW